VLFPWIERYHECIEQDRANGQVYRALNAIQHLPFLKQHRMHECKRWVIEECWLNRLDNPARIRAANYMPSGQFILRDILAGASPRLLLWCYEEYYHTITHTTTPQTINVCVWAQVTVCPIFVLLVARTHLCTYVCNNIVDNILVLEY